MKTIAKRCEHTIEVLSSKFIAIAFPLSTKEEFKSLLDQIKKDYKKAKHYCYAFRANNGTKSSDDGEPKGVAGRPILELLYKKDLMNVACVVVRYFGGTKLGASRLLRTYLKVAIETIEMCQLEEI